MMDRQYSKDPDGHQYHVNQLAITILLSSKLIRLLRQGIEVNSVTFSKSYHSFTLSSKAAPLAFILFMELSTLFYQTWMQEPDKMVPF